MWDSLKSDLFDFVSTIQDDTEKALTKVVGEEGDVDEEAEIQGHIQDLQRSFKTFSTSVSESQEKEYQTFLKKFSLGNKAAEISELLDEESVGVDVSRYYADLVPTKLTPEEFWSRYFFKLEVLLWGGSEDMFGDLEQDEEELDWVDSPSYSTDKGGAFPKNDSSVPIPSSAEFDAIKTENLKLRGQVKVLADRVAELESQIAMSAKEDVAVETSISTTEKACSMGNNEAVEEVAAALSAAQVSVSPVDTPPRANPASVISATLDGGDDEEDVPWDSSSEKSDEESPRALEHAPTEVTAQAPAAEAEVPGEGERKGKEEVSKIPIPNHFFDDELMIALGLKDEKAVKKPSRFVRGTKSFPGFAPVLLLLLRLKFGVRRLYKRRLVKEGENPFVQALWDSFLYFTYPRTTDGYWNPQRLDEVATELAKKMSCVPGKFESQLENHPLHRPRSAQAPLVFDTFFLEKVAAYHEKLRRPDGTFTAVVDERVAKLRALERVSCVSCGRRRQVYCCWCMQRLENAENWLPQRVQLPFDILVIQHWQESVRQSTGVHAKILANDDQVQFEEWPRLREGRRDWAEVAEALDAERDVLLFPFEDACPASLFQWNSFKPSSADQARGDDRSEKFRLVVIEASWQHGQVVSRQIVEARKKKDQPPIRSVKIENVVGQYWKFQEVGHSAISTVEAIAHCAMDAGAGNFTQRDFDDLLLLFRLQQSRVYEACAQGDKKPRAIQPEGSWRT
jgi:hypothetical protein